MKRRNKYGAQKVEFEGETFDSKLELARYKELRFLEAAGDIQNLRRQVRFPIEVNGVKICTYVADFCYDEFTQIGAAHIVEDVKSPISAKIRDYLLKKKLMRAVYGVEIREVYTNANRPLRKKAAGFGRRWSAK